jgi:hypothetical protein
MLRRLEHQRTAGAKRRGDLRRSLQQRVIPRHDPDHDTNRLIADPRQDAGLFERQDGALLLIGKARIIMIILRRVAKLDLHLGEQLAVVAHFDIGETVGIVSQQFGKAPQHRAALAGRNRRPGLIARWPSSLPTIFDLVSRRGVTTGGARYANLLDTERRLAEMDALDIDMQVLSLTSPGVQMLPSTAPTPWRPSPTIASPR